MNTTKAAVKKDTSTFGRLREAVVSHVNLMLASGAKLYQTSVDPDELWNVYLDSMTEDMNPLFRTRTEHDCQTCRQFIKRFGGLVTINPTTLRPTTIWDFDAPEPYGAVVSALREEVLDHPITDLWIGESTTCGTPQNRSLNKETGEVEVWTHLYMEVPKALTMRKDNIPTAVGRARSNHQTFARAVKEISAYAVDTVLELIDQNSLYRGEQYKASVRALKQAQDRVPAGDDIQFDNWCWLQSAKNPAVCGIRNSAIGTLLVDLSEGKDLETAVGRYEAVTAPANYRRSTSLITHRMVEQAREKIAELGLGDSLAHRHAVLEDIKVPDVLWANRGAKKRMSGDPLADLAGDLKAAAANLDRVEDVSWEHFRDHILPNAEGLEVLLERRLKPNCVSLLAPVNADAPTLTPWTNNFCWAYAGNVSDSMKERVKSAGGRVDGDLRFSIQWNEDGQNHDDLDAHCVTAEGSHIYFGDKRACSYGGNLDVDIITPSGVAVENITWPDRGRMPDGEYRFSVHTFSKRGGRGGFRAEIEFDGTLFEFDYAQDTRNKQTAEVATVVKRGNTFELKPKLKPAQGPGTPVWGLATNSFHPVTVVCHSPNYWEGEKPSGHRHVMLMLDGLENDEQPNGFYVEYLKPELNVHRKVFEVLGGRMKVEPATPQLSGLGFSTSKRNKVTVRVSGKTQRVFNVNF